MLEAELNHRTFFFLTGRIVSETIVKKYKLLPNNFIDELKKHNVKTDISPYLSTGLRQQQLVQHCQLSYIIFIFP